MFLQKIALLSALCFTVSSLAMPVVASMKATAKDACFYSKKIAGLKNSAGVIKDAATAISVAKSVAIAAFGLDSVAIREPLVAIEAGATWSVVGKLPSDLIGGDLVVRMCRVDGRIFHLEVDH